MSKIITPPKKILTAGASPSMQTLDTMMKQRINPEKDISLDVHADIVVRDVITKKVVDRRRFRCKSFVANFLKILCGKMRQANVPITSVENVDHGAADVPFIRAEDLFLVSDVALEFPFLGPIVGVGTTAATPADTKLEKQLTHGTNAQDLSAETGTCGATSNTIQIYVSVSPGWTNDEWIGWFAEITSGALNGERRFIFDNTVQTLNFSVAGAVYTNQKNPLPSEPDGETFKIFTWGQLTHGTVGITAPIDDGDVTSTFTITRTFTNSTGGSVNITEFGLACNMYRLTSSYNTSSYLLIRDVAEAVELQNGQEMTLTYTFTVVA